MNFQFHIIKVKYNKYILKLEDIDMLNNIKRTIKGIKLQYKLIKGMKKDITNNTFYASENY